MAKRHQPTQDGVNEGTALADLRDRASSAVEQFGETATDQIGNSPLIALAGGAALGALIAAVLPQTKGESRLLEPAGRRVNDAGRTAAEKVREAGKAKVDELAGDKVRDFFGLGGSTSA